MSNDLAYSSAVVYCLDRETGEIKEVLLYPIVKIELKNFTGTGIEIAKTLIVKDLPGLKTEWIEEGK